jgi:hypothetical protein
MGYFFHQTTTKEMMKVNKSFKVNIQEFIDRAVSDFRELDMDELFDICRVVSFI